MMTTVEVLRIVGISALSGIGVTIILTCIIIANFDKLLLVFATIQSLFVRVSSSARKGSISNRIRGELISASKKIGADDIFPKDIKIEWVKDEDAATFFSQNQMVVRVSNSIDPQLNTVRVVNELVKNGVAIEAKRYLSSEMSSATDYTLTRKLLYHMDRHALDYYDRRILTARMIDEAPALRNYIQDFAKVDHNGMFTTVFLNEVTKYSNYLFPVQIDDEITSQITGLLRYLTEVAEAMNIKVPFDNNYRKGPFRFTLAFTAKDETLSDHGESYYIDRIIRTMTEGRCNTEYLFALGFKRTIAERIIASTKEKQSGLDVVEHNYVHISQTGERVEAICYEINRKH